jgi:threonine aldolase
MDFRSDNTVPVSPLVMQALLNANETSMPAYGHDPVTHHARQRFTEIFEREVDVFFVGTGTAANVLALSTMAPPHGAIYCHPEAHINVDECGAPEFATAGAKLVSIPGEHGKISLHLLRRQIEKDLEMRPHAAQPSVISLSQTTEAGTLYQKDELQAICQVAKEFGLLVHMDGARFTNALVALGESPAALTWQSGVDVLSFGGTKNGAMFAEAVVFFNRDLAKNADYTQKRQGQLFSKMRYMSCQFLALFNEELWLKNALHANHMATRLAEILQRCEGVSLLNPVEANEVFVDMADYLSTHLKNHGVSFYNWGIPGQKQYRFVCSFHTHMADMHELERLCQEAHR